MKKNLDPWLSIEHPSKTYQMYILLNTGSSENAHVYNTLVNVYVDLLVFMRIAGTS